jgi:hypothetical protein
MVENIVYLCAAQDPELLRNMPEPHCALDALQGLFVAKASCSALAVPPFIDMLSSAIGEHI